MLADSAGLLSMRLELQAVITVIVKYAILILILYLSSTTLHSVYFSPLNAYPGPKVYAATRIAITWHRVNGSIVDRLSKLHAKYGAVVRIGPSELSFTDATAWKAIYGAKTSIGGQMPKDPAFYTSSDETSIGGDVVDESHARQRKVLSHAFSERALMKQEGLIRTYVDKLVQKMSGKADAGEVIDLVRMLNFTTFDIMSDLAFGEPLDLLEKDGYHEWVAAIFNSLKALTFMIAISHFPALKFLLNALLRPVLEAKRKQHVTFYRERVDRRLAKQASKPDIWSLLLDTQEGPQITQGEIYGNAGFFMVAGTETTATLLSGLLFLLLGHEEQMDKLKSEIRALKEHQLDLLELPKLKYLNACIEEGLRIYPPAPDGLPRKTPKQGAEVCGRFVPGGTTISIPHYPTYHSPDNFESPETFAPERWLAGAGFEKDKKHALNPFSMGPRNCLGQSLAYHEMRLILAKLIWNFDFELANAAEGNWLDQRVLLLWEKRPLLVRAQRAVR